MPARFRLPALLLLVIAVGLLSLRMMRVLMPAPTPPVAGAEQPRDPKRLARARRSTADALVRLESQILDMKEGRRPSDPAVEQEMARRRDEMREQVRSLTRLLGDTFAMPTTP